MSSGELVHYGVKGMHWGIRKNTPTNPNYSQRQQIEDRNKFGKGGVKRINRRMNAGKTHVRATKKEQRFKSRVAFTAAGAVYAAAVLRNVAQMSAQSIAVKAETNRGRAHAATTMGLPSKPTNGPTYANKNRRGVHKITNL